MILDTLMLENFGAYAGRQQLILTPEPDRPIVLFGGMNGGGKTTLLDALQLVLYGPKARLSNRGRVGYRDYLGACIHRAADPGEGAGLTLRFRRVHEGRTRHYEVQRSWRLGVKGIEESLRVLLDGELDHVLTEHWDRTIDSYLPVGIAHLFFFDGEQIKDLAEGQHAAEIIGTAIHSLLGLDLVERLETDLKVLERRKRAEDLDPESLVKLRQLEHEIAHLDEEQEKLAMEQGRLVNEAGRCAELLRRAEEQFRKEGGELFLRRRELQQQHADLSQQREALENKLRELAAGPLPLLMAAEQLAGVEAQARHETRIRHARLLRNAIKKRDEELLEFLTNENLTKSALRRIRQALREDRELRQKTADEELLLDADDHLASEVAHLRQAILPAAEAEARQLLARIGELGEEILRLDGEIAQVPEAERIALTQEDLDRARAAHQQKQAELEALEIRRRALCDHRQTAEDRLDSLGVREMEHRFADQTRQRILIHSARVRETLAVFRERIVSRHTRRIEALMLESFRKLLRKASLVRDLTIDPATFAVSLTGPDGRELPFDRLSAGERQILATSLLWGLARASGRPVPTVIDTPLGRLDSSHRRHLVERYFSAASHQVLLLSTDEEIVGNYLEAVRPFIARCYHLAHDDQLGATCAQEGYFPPYEAAC